MFDVGDFIFSYDLISAYHHIEIFEEHEQYLGLAWFFEGKIRYFVFAVLSFGISTTGYIFSKVLREVVKDFRSKGKRIIMFLDGLVGENFYDTAVKSSREVNDQLKNFGFLIAHDKCHWSPCQKLDWLGYSWDTENGIIFVKEERIQKLEKCFTYALCQVEKGKILFRVRFLASIVGQLISMHAVISDTVRQSTRFLYDCALGRASWQACVRLTQDVLTELSFWDKNCKILNSKG